MGQGQVSMAGDNRLFGDPADPYELTQDIGGGMQARVFKCVKRSERLDSTSVSIQANQFKEIGGGAGMRAISNRASGPQYAPVRAS